MKIKIPQLLEDDISAHLPSFPRECAIIIMMTRLQGGEECLPAGRQGARGREVEG